MQVTPPIRANQHHQYVMFESFAGRWFCFERLSHSFHMYISHLVSGVTVTELKFANSLERICLTAVCALYLPPVILATWYFQLVILHLRSYKPTQRRSLHSRRSTHWSRKSSKTAGTGTSEKNNIEEKSEYEGLKTRLPGCECNKQVI
jgi:hypothetical protein